MRRAKSGIITVAMALMVLPMLLALPGCFWGWRDDGRGHDGDHHGDHHEGDRHDEGRGDR